MSIKNKTMNNVSTPSKFVTIGVGLVITTAMIIIQFGFEQSANTSTAQDMYNLGYEEGCHDASPSVEAKDTLQLQFFLFFSFSSC